MIALRDTYLTSFMLQVIVLRAEFLCISQLHVAYINLNYLRQKPAPQSATLHISYAQLRPNSFYCSASQFIGT